NIIISPRQSTKTNATSLTEVFGLGSVLDSLFNTNQQSVSEVKNLAFTLDYIYKFKRHGEKISLTTHYTIYEYSDFQNVDTDYCFPTIQTPMRDNRLQPYSRRHISLYTAQIDYELPLKNISKLEVG